jgi:amino acid adenylation domain-containing protein
MNNEQLPPQEAIAIVGMAGRFPRARNLDEFWRNLREGVECVSFFNDDQVQWLPIEHPPVVSDPRYVKARAVMEKPEWFDAAFFGMNPREAAIMDPQHRVFLECAWEALEDAGCNPDTYAGLIGVFAGASMNTYLFSNLLTNPDLVKDFGLFSSMIMNDGDFVPTRVSYKLNLRGPSINVQTACSTSLVAVCLAAQNLLTYRCDVALAGGVSITFPPQRGQHHLEGGIMSNDGHCRTFDAKASGTVLGDGAGIVVLKRLSEALADGDRVYAVIKGNAINNDGSVKIGYTAPSVDGQAECIAMAQAEAGIAPESISYIEAHGTGTPLGDPIEIAGLAKAFGVKPGGPKTCAVGSVKSNIGHLDIAAGVAGLIKTVLALQHGEIPPSLHFETPNPKLELDRTPFFVNASPRAWPRGETPRRAGVSSFGIGGTNAHVVLEEGPAPLPTPPSRRAQHLLVLSAKTQSALDAATANLAAHLEAHSEQQLADVAFSLQTRRKGFPHRRALAVDSREAAIAALKTVGGTGVTGVADGTPTVAFMFPGQGAQAVNMGRELYLNEPRFREIVDRCCELLKPKLGLDLRDVLYPSTGVSDDAQKLLTQTRLTQPALFVIEYALADLLMGYGVKPNAMIGHSLGEYVAACIAGVFSLEDALAIVAERARLMQAQPEGAMLAVRAPVEKITPFLTQTLSLAATNACGLCVVSGPFDAITALEKKLGDSDVASRRLATSHAFHSAMMDGAVRPLADFISRFQRRAPRIPFISNVTGQWITAEQAMDPAYWANHLRNPVRFAEGVARLMEPGARRVLLEVGPGETLVGLARQEPKASEAGITLAASLGRAKSGLSEAAAVLHALGRLWVAGADIAWRQLYAGEARQYVSLPTYPFERKRYLIEPGITFAGAASESAAAPRTARPAATPLDRDSANAPAGVDASSRVSEPSNPAVQPRATEDAGSLAALRRLFGELSGMDLATASGEASFYELGFDSLFLTQASLAVTRRFGVDVTFRQLREQLQSLGRLAAHIDAARGDVGAGVADPGPGTAQPAANMTPESGRDRAAGHDVRLATSGPDSPPSSPDGAPFADRVVPLSDAQRELWFASQLGSEVSSAYNESSNIRLNGRLDDAALQRAFQRLVARHEALRTTILPAGEGQRIAATSNARLTVHDFTGGDASQRDQRVREFIDAEVERPFELTAGPLFRAHLLRLETDRHIIVIVVHHIICDGWSLGILQRDLGEMYAVETGHDGTAQQLRGDRAEAPSFSEYALRQAQMRETAAFKAAEDFWLGQFADDVPVLDLPTDRPRPASRTFAGAFLLHTLPSDLAVRLKALAAQHECTLFTVLLAAFDVLLHRLSGQRDLVVGIPAAAQVMDGLDDVVGHFANLLPVRVRITPEQTFADFLAAVRRRQFDCLENWRYPFGSLLQRLNIARDSSRMPLANVVFNSTRLRGSLPFGDLTGDVEGNAKRFSHFDLNFNFAATADGISFGAYYSTELFDETTVARWFGHFETLLRGIAAAPATALSRLPLLSTAERDQILRRWNDTAMPYERDATIAELFDAQAARTPDAIAIVTETERITYRQLNERAGRLARRLREAGVGADTLVGIFLERTPQLLVAIFGILKAGGAYVPLDPTYPADRLEFIVNDTRMPIMVTQASLVSQLPAGGFDFMVVDDESPAASRVGRTLTQPNRATPDAESLAYIIYTSGSTGKPKGVAIVQRCVVLLVAWARQLYTREELDGVLFSTSASFDISIFEIFCPLCLGGKIVLADNVLQLATLKTANEVHFLSGVPSAIAEVVRLKIVPPSVTTVALAGETFPQPLVDALYALPHMQRVFEHYGPTECTVYSTGGLRHPHTRPSLGKPFPNEQIYILDENLEPVPVGVRGEIYIAGDKLARGYLNRPELTAEKFLANPFAATPHSQISNLKFEIRGGNAAAPAAAPRMYRSGDLACWLADGTIQSLGRTDHQVKVRGYRIELGEVQSALARHPAVAECVVLARPDASGNNRLLGYVVPREGSTADARTLKEHLQHQLPDYMVPSAVTVLNRWPLTSNGKLDRQALPDPEGADAGADYVAPGTTTEELVADVWRDVLGVKRVGIHDNFFELGGHSLLATQVIARINEGLEVELSMREFFAAPTVAGLAVTIEAALIQEIKTTDSAGAVPVTRDALAPLKE